MATAIALLLSLLVLGWCPAPAHGRAGEHAPSSKYCSSYNCRLPDCFCAGRRGPDNMQTHDIPQIVMLTFDDAVNKQNIKFYRQLLNGDRLNPNGCPITATFFVSHDWTDYKFVKELYLAGHEVADHSISHRLPRNWWRKASYRDWEEEMEGQRKNIANKAGVPRFEVRGVRVPFLEIGGDAQFEMMADNQFLYDSSFLTGPYNERDWRLPAWPYTLEYAPELEYCDNANCPKSNFTSIWEVPLNRWLGLDGQACPMVDACTTQVLKDKNDALRYLWKNFNRHYGKNRAPLGINLHAVWLEKKFKLEALEEFIDGILDLHDVYMINIAKTIDWMKTPTTLSAISKFEPWLNCGSKRVLVQRRKPHHRKESPPRSRNVTQEDTIEEFDDLPKAKIAHKVNMSKENATNNDKGDVSDVDKKEAPKRHGKTHPRKVKVGSRKRSKGLRKTRPSTTASPVIQVPKEKNKTKVMKTANATDDENQDAKEAGVTELKVGKMVRNHKKVKSGAKAGKAGTQTGSTLREATSSIQDLKATIVTVIFSVSLGVFLLL